MDVKRKVRSGIVQNGLYISTRFSPEKEEVDHGERWSPQTQAEANGRTAEAGQAGEVIPAEMTASEPGEGQ
jgi:hypothetical protein